MTDTTITRWVPRHPVMEVRSQPLPMPVRGGTTHRIMWRPEGTDMPWLPVAACVIDRYYTQILPPDPSPSLFDEVGE